MSDQKELFGFKDMQPKMNLKKIITKERMKEIQSLLDKQDGKGAAEKLRDLNDSLERMEKRITNKKK